MARSTGVLYLNRMDGEQVKKTALIRALKQMVLDYGGAAVIADAIILENKECFDYIQYKAALNNDAAVQCYETHGMRDKTHVKRPAVQWDDDFEEILIKFPDKAEVVLQSKDKAHRRRKQLQLPVRKYVKRSA